MIIMLVRSIVTPANELMTVSTQDLAKKAFDLIVENGFLSVPVVDEKKFIGFLSKQYIYDKFFESKESNLDAFLEKPVSEFISEQVESVSENLSVEEAADLFFNNKIRFIPVADSYGNFVGIVTQKSLFRIITKIYGLKDPKIVILMDDFKGMLAKLADIISKNDANIVNIAHIDTEVMGLQEVSIRVECNDLDKLVEKLKEKGYKVKEVVK
jgi:acetoin utilization protein AcuB